MLQLYLQLLNTCSEQEKFKQLYETYHRLMHWEAQRVLQDRQLAEDAVQESFLRMIKNFHKIGEYYENYRTAHDRFSSFNVRFYSIDNFYIPQGGFSTFL